MILFKRMILCAGVLMLLVSGCTTVPKSTETRRSLAVWCEQAGIEYAFDPVDLSARLSKNGRTAKVWVGSQTVNIGAESVMLSGPILLERQELYAPEDFAEKVFCRLDAVLCVVSIRKKDFLIVIDPGHGGKDPGAASASGLKEKELVLDIARRVERILQQSGHGVRLTRSSDVFISLEDRTQRATEWAADMFVSIHANASPSDRVVGFEVWAPRALTQEDFNDAQRKKNQRIFFNTLNMQRRNDALEKTVADLSYRYKYQQSMDLASVMARNYTRSISNRGIKQSGFFVLRNTLIPSVLVEVGFLSNSREAQRLKASSARDEIAQSIAAGIKDYIKKF